MTSEKQIEANRENAKLSTGAHDTEKTKFNAVKHGLCAKKFVLEAEREEFNNIFKELIEDLNPQGILELRIVERIVSALWDLQRIAEKESIYESNEDIKKKINNMNTLLKMDGFFGGDEKKKEALEQQLRDLIFPNEIFIKYKTEAENRFYKALKLWKEFAKT
jgi:hypothetical protein